MTSIVSGEYVTFKHIKTRKVVVLEIEIAEENFQEVITKLGMPIGGESKPVAIALLSSSSNGRTSDFESANRGSTPREETKTEGEKLRTRAVMLCKEASFQDFCFDVLGSGKYRSESEAKEELSDYCKISSRSELATNIEAQIKFKEMLEKYKDWQAENNYSENLSRV